VGELGSGGQETQSKHLLPAPEHLLNVGKCELALPGLSLVCSAPALKALDVTGDRVGPWLRSTDFRTHRGHCHGTDPPQAADHFLRVHAHAFLAQSPSRWHSKDKWVFPFASELGIGVVSHRHIF
jgi:hypothetical protein